MILVALNSYLAVKRLEQLKAMEFIASKKSYYVHHDWNLSNFSAILKLGKNFLFKKKYILFIQTFYLFKPRSTQSASNNEVSLSNPRNLSDDSNLLMRNFTSWPLVYRALPGPLGLEQTQWNL